MLSKHGKAETVREFLRNQRGRFVTVTFRKVDGTERRLNMQPATIAHRLVPNPSPSHARAAETRRILHPNLIAVWDVKNSQAVAKDARKRGAVIDPDVQRSASARSINSETIISIAAGGKILTLAELLADKVAESR